MGLTGAPKTGHFYPRLVYNAITVDFEDPLTGIAISEVPVSGRNLASSGKQETLYLRMERTVQLVWANLETVKLKDLRTYFADWGGQGKQGVLTLDRFNTCQGQWEYDEHNTTFNKAEWVGPPLVPQRFTPQRALYTVTLTFRQGA